MPRFASLQIWLVPRSAKSCKKGAICCHGWRSSAAARLEVLGAVCVPLEHGSAEEAAILSGKATELEQKVLLGLADSI